MKALDKLRTMHEALEKSGIDGPVRDAELILTHSLGIDRIDLYKDNPDIAEDILAEIDHLVERRSKREPLQYVLGYTEFYGLRIMVGPGVLIPRPETELLAEKAIEIIRSQNKNSVSEEPGISSFILHPSSLVVLDLCTGSGCLAIALAKEFPDADVYGTDTSEIALEYAKKNAELNNVKSITFLKGDLFEPVRNMRFDVIVSNPPYIQTPDLGYLQPEIRDWEPVEALDGGEDGLDYYRRIISGARNHLKDCGTLIFEIGAGQSEEVVKMSEKACLGHISLLKDYAGIDRIVKVQKE
jgi:release factor glutamine methyltransferase